MKVSTTLLIIYIFLTVNLLSQNSYEINDTVSLSKILKMIEEKNNVSFSYNHSQIQNEKIPFKAGNYNLDEVLNLVFAESPYVYEFIDSKRIIVIPKNEASDPYLFCGYVYDYNDAQPLPYVNIFDPKLQIGTETDTDGYFEMVVNNKTASFVASYIGYEIQTLGSEKSDPDNCKMFYLKTAEQLLSTVILREYLGDGIDQSTNSKSIVLDPGEMNVLPGLVDNDIFATTLLLPGINSPKESLDDIFIRGGTPDQNLVLWDGIPMYHTSHLFGTISAFNPFIIDQVDVYRSSIGSEFGGRVSGVIDIKSKSKIPDKVNIGLGVNMTHFHMDIETPLWKNSALFFSYRRSITDIWASPTFLNYAERVFQGSKVEPERFSESNLAYNDFFAFNDANLKWVYNHNKSKFKISMFGALNELDYSTALPNVNAFLLDKLDLNNGGAMFSWERKWSDELDSKLVITNSEFNYDYELFLQLEDETIEPPNRVWSNNKITDGGLKLTFDWKPEQYQRFRFGWQLTDNIINVNLGRTEPDTTEMQMQNFENQIQTLFGEYALELPDIVNMDIGLRFQNSPILEKRFFEPRISIVTKLNEDMRLKASTSKQFQFVSQLVAFDINDLGFSNQIWVAADDQTIPVIESNQWVGGIMYEKDDWTLDVEGYVKELVGITSLSVLSDLLSQYAQGKSKVRGVDILLKRRYKNFRSWLSFTLSETLYEFPSIPPGSFPAPHDQKYIIQWVNLYKQDQWEFSLGVNLRSGLPYRNASGLELEQNSQGNFYYAIQYEELNAARLDPYFRVDGSVIYNFGQQEGIDGYIGFSIQNMTNHRNVLGREFFRGRQDGSGKPTLLSNDELGLKWTPNFTVNVSF